MHVTTSVECDLLSKIWETSTKIIWVSIILSYTPQSSSANLKQVSVAELGLRSLVGKNR